MASFADLKCVKCEMKKDTWSFSNEQGNKTDGTAICLKCEKPEQPSHVAVDPKRKIDWNYVNTKGFKPGLTSGDPYRYGGVLIERPGKDDKHWSELARESLD